MSAYANLTAAQELIRDPQNWTKNAYARFANGRETGNLNEACKWCSVGAVLKVTGRPVEAESLSEFDYLGRAINDMKAGAVPEFNDSHNHAEVMWMFDKARELARADDV
jgi:hypothetical protein